jgi:hypothetical protein
MIQAPEKVKICAILKKGGTRDMAAQAIGCHPRTIYRAAQNDPEFAKEMVEAEISIEDICLTSISDAAKDSKNWRAAFKLLERVYPERYAPGKRAPLSGKHLDQIAQVAVGAVLRELPDSAVPPELRERLHEAAERCLQFHQREGLLS